MRTFVSAIAVILGALLSAVAVPSIWLDRNIVQEDGFVALAAPLGRDEAFQQRLAAAAVGALDTSSIPDALADAVQPVLESAATSLAGLPGYPAAWEETLRRSHRLSFSTGGSPMPEAGAAASLTLDVAPLVALGIEEISSTSGLPLEAPAETLIDVGQPSQRQLVDALRGYAPMGYGLAVGAGIAFLLALVAARRRGAVIFSMGVAGLLLAGLWTAGLQVGVDAVLSTGSGNELADMFRNELVAASAGDFRAWILGTAIAGSALLVAGLVIRIASPGRRPATR
ncbi:hypothetical protein M1E17_16315 [Arthrobacter sp. D1-29]